jgi:hypothetical protein
LQVSILENQSTAVSKFQDVDFRTVGEFLDYLPPLELKIVERLRALVFECIPNVKEKLTYNVSFYYRHSRILFIWPGSVPWGNTRRDSVNFGFCKGHLLSDPWYLEKGDRKEVYIKSFYNPREIDAEAIRQLLYETVVVDEEEWQAKKKKKTR